MIKNYLVVTFRNFIRNANYTLINVLGLSIGVTCCIILFLMIRYDLSFDKFHSRIESTFLIGRESKNASGVDYSAITPYPFAQAYRNDFPDVPLMTQYQNQGQVLVTVGEEKYQVEDVIFGDSLFFEVLDFTIISGNPRKDLGEPGKVFITQSFSEKYLKGATTGRFKISNVADLDVVGVIADPPASSSVKFSMVISMPTLNKDILGLDMNQWGLNSAATSIVILPPEVSALQMEKRFEKFVEKYYEGEDERDQTYRLVPFAEFHFDKNFNEEAADKSGLLMLGILAAFILSIACINFVNLATALAVKKSKEIGIRKTLGAKRTQLAAYFLGETFIITVLSVLISLGIVELMLPWLNGFLDKHLADSLFTHAALIVFVLILVVVITFFSGLYPSIILSGYDPVAVLKNKMTTAGTGSVSVRKVLVAFQFLIAQTLIIGTLVVSDQMSYIHNSSLGFRKEAIINVAMPQNKPEIHEAFRSRLLANPTIENVSFSIGAPVADAGLGTSYNLEGNHEQRFDVVLKTGDENYLTTYDLELIAGRWINEADAKLAGPPLDWDERKYVLVVNETAARQLGFENPADIVNKNIEVGLNDIVAPVVGVVKDFHVSSMHDKIEPVVLLNFPYFYYDAGIKLRSDDLPETIAFIEKTWNDLNGDYYFQYQFLDQYLSNLYRQEERTFTLFKIFSGISIFIGCLGLYGLISFMANQKLKEVGIRKVLGASVANIVMLFSKEFIKLIAIAFAVAAPLSWYAMREWLSGFAYNVGIHPWVFVVGLVATLLIAIATVSYRSIRAAISNPVDTLRTE